MTFARTAGALAIVLAAFGTYQVASAAWIHGKGWLAQRLIAFAWERAQATRQPARPWPGADLKPVARLTLARQHTSLYVLDEAHGRALAFGPAHLGGTAAPGAAGNSVIVAHRDTHFAVLRDLRMDDAIDVEAPGGAHWRYRVREMRVVEKHDAEVAAPTASPTLTLVTCYPFDAVRPGTALRYVVVAERVS